MVIYIILAAALFVFLLGYLKWKLTAIAALACIKKNGIKTSEVDIKKYSEYAVKKLLHLRVDETL